MALKLWSLRQEGKGKLSERSEFFPFPSVLADSGVY